MSRKQLATKIPQSTAKQKKNSTLQRNKIEERVTIQATTNVFTLYDES